MNNGGEGCRDVRSPTRCTCRINLHNTLRGSWGPSSHVVQLVLLARGLFQNQKKDGTSKRAVIGRLDGRKQTQTCVTFVLSVNHSHNVASIVTTGSVVVAGFNVGWSPVINCNCFKCDTEGLLQRDIAHLSGRIYARFLCGRKCVLRITVRAFVYLSHNEV